jgi:hypothetical protein
MKVKAAPAAAIRSLYQVRRRIMGGVSLPEKDLSMKIKIVTPCFLFLCVLCSTSMFAQLGNVLQNTAQPLVLTDHPEHAMQHSMATDQNLRGMDNFLYVHGEQPVLDYADDKYETPLGDIARAYRKEHALEKKATVSFDK